MTGIAAGLLRALLAACCLSLAACPAQAQEAAVEHASWDEVLRHRVREGQVDYAGLKSDRQPLERYLTALRYVETGQLASTQAHLAFWINAYNACVITGVLEHYPIRSVKEVPGFFDALTYQIGGEALTVNQLKANGRRLGDWRAHFAMVDASLGSPPLRAEAYVPERLEEQLDEQAQAFLLDPDRGMRVERSWRVLWVSRLFQWYRKDFILNGPLTSESLLLVLRRHVDPELLAQAAQRPVALNFLEYDWALNDQQGSGE